jgi:hypothetical protein
MEDDLPAADPGWVARLPAPDPPPPDPSGSPRYELWRLYAKPNIPWPGWSRLINELHEQLVGFDPAYQLHQVKEKFGGLRFYAEFNEDVRERCNALVQEAEHRSFGICERCGEAGRLREDRLWRRTLCDQCDELVAAIETR